MQAFFWQRDFLYHKPAQHEKGASLPMRPKEKTFA
jgi:hypothetical protein